jgi:hypothetical protein
MQIINWFKGKKTYIVAILLVVYAIICVFTGQLTLTTAIAVVLNGLGLSALRASVK